MNALRIVISFKIFVQRKFFLNNNTHTIMTSSIPNKAKLNAKRQVDSLLPRFIEEFKSILPSGFICLQDSAPAHTAKLAQD